MRTIKGEKRPRKIWARIHFLERSVALTVYEPVVCIVVESDHGVEIAVPKRTSERLARRHDFARYRARVRIQFVDPLRFHARHPHCVRVKGDVLWAFYW